MAPIDALDYREFSTDIERIGTYCQGVDGAICPQKDRGCNSTLGVEGGKVTSWLGWSSDRREATPHIYRVSRHREGADIALVIEARIDIGIPGGDAPRGGVKSGQIVSGLPAKAIERTTGVKRVPAHGKGSDSLARCYAPSQSPGGRIERNDTALLTG